MQDYCDGGNLQDQIFEKKEVQYNVNKLLVKINHDYAFNLIQPIQKRLSFKNIQSLSCERARDDRYLHK